MKTSTDEHRNGQSARPAPGEPPPCRGCLPDCRYYSRCRGTPWRLPEAVEAMQTVVNKRP